MPKVKPDNVIRHEIVLGRAERELIEGPLTAFMINRITNPFTSMTPAGAVALGGLIILIIDWMLSQVGLDVNWPTIVEDMTPSQVQDWLETQNLVGAGIGGLAGAIFGPWGAALGAILGSAAVEVGEHQQEVFSEAIEKSRIASLINLRNSLNSLSMD